MDNEWGDLFPDEVVALINAGITPDEAVARIRQLDQYSRTFPSLPAYVEPPRWYRWYDKWWARLLRKLDWRG